MNSERSGFLLFWENSKTEQTFDGLSDVDRVAARQSRMIYIKFEKITL